MAEMFNGSYATTIDLSSFDMSGVEGVYGMFAGAIVTTGYARTQADADILNSADAWDLTNDVNVFRVRAPEPEEY